jgi:hypothetical protein
MTLRHHAQPLTSAQHYDANHGNESPYLPSEMSEEQQLFTAVGRFRPWSPCHHHTFGHSCHVQSKPALLISRWTWFRCLCLSVCISLWCSPPFLLQHFLRPLHTIIAITESSCRPCLPASCNNVESACRTARSFEADRRAVS